MVRIAGRHVDGTAARVDEHVLTDLQAAAPVALDRGAVVLGGDRHRRRLRVHDEQAASAQRDEAEAAGGVDDRTDRPVDRPQDRIFTGGAARRLARHEIERRRRVVDEGVRREVGVDALEPLAVLIRDEDERAVGRGKRRVRLARAGAPHCRLETVQCGALSASKMTTCPLGKPANCRSGARRTGRTLSEWRRRAPGGSTSS